MSYFPDEQPYCLKSRYHQVLVENINPDSFLLKVDAVDADLNPKLKFYLTGEKSEDFSLDKVSGKLFFCVYEFQFFLLIFKTS